MHATLDALAAFPDVLARLYGEVPEGFATWVPTSWEGVPSEPFSPLAQLCHVRDIEREGYHRRFRRVLAEEHPFLPGVDGEGLAVARRYEEENAAKVLEEIRVAREETLRLISGLRLEQMTRTADFEGYGSVTTRSLIHYLCSHDQQHLAGLQWLLGKIEARP
jgi:hypothetical protein